MDNKKMRICALAISAIMTANPCLAMAEEYAETEVQTEAYTEAQTETYTEAYTEAYTEPAVEMQSMQYEDVAELPSENVSLNEAIPEGQVAQETQNTEGATEPTAETEAEKSCAWNQGDTYIEVFAMENGRVPMWIEVSSMKDIMKDMEDDQKKEWKKNWRERISQALCEATGGGDAEDWEDAIDGMMIYSARAFDNGGNEIRDGVSWTITIDDKDLSRQLESEELTMEILGSDKDGKITVPKGDLTSSLAGEDIVLAELNETEGEWIILVCMNSEALKNAENKAYEEQLDMDDLGDVGDPIEEDGNDTPAETEPVVEEPDSMDDLGDLFIEDTKGSETVPEAEITVEKSNNIEEKTAETERVVEKSNNVEEKPAETEKVVETEAVHEHSWDSWKMVIEPSCETNGMKKRACVCGDTEVVTVEKAGHVNGAEIATDEMEATCSTPGSIDYITKCVKCGKVTNRRIVEIPASGHVDGRTTKSNVVPATCTAAGSYGMTYRCKFCGDVIRTETVETEAIGHTYGSWRKKESATCTEDGSIYRICNDCGYEETEVVKATEHKAGKTVKRNIISATCTTAGSYDKIAYCSKCGEEIESETVEIPALEHSWGEWTTVTSKGNSQNRRRTCSRCGKTQTEKVATTSNEVTPMTMGDSSLINTAKSKFSSNAATPSYGTYSSGAAGVISGADDDTGGYSEDTSTGSVIGGSVSAAGTNGTVRKTNSVVRPQTNQAAVIPKVSTSTKATTTLHGDVKKTEDEIEPISESTVDVVERKNEMSKKNKNEEISGSVVSKIDEKKVESQTEAIEEETTEAITEATTVAQTETVEETEMGTETLTEAETADDKDESDIIETENETNDEVEESPWGEGNWKIIASAAVLFVVGLGCGLFRKKKK